MLKIQASMWDSNVKLHKASREGTTTEYTFSDDPLFSSEMASHEMEEEEEEKEPELPKARRMAEMLSTRMSNCLASLAQDEKEENELLCQMREKHYEEAESWKSNIFEEIYQKGYINRYLYGNPQKSYVIQDLDTQIGRSRNRQRLAREECNFLRDQIDQTHATIERLENEEKPVAEITTEMQYVVL